MIELKEPMVAFDVDDTLVNWQPDQEATTEEYDYFGVPKHLAPIERHITLLKGMKSRGYFILVWSGNGPAGAKQVVTKLGLTKYVDVVAQKPIAVVDDKPVGDWLEKRIYLGK